MSLANTILKTKLLLIILLLLSIPVFAEVNTESIKQDFDFRQTNWGMTMNEVLTTESLKVVSNENNRVFYQTSILNKDCYLFYYFENDNKLSSAGYFFDIKHTNPNDYIEDYLKLQDSLCSKYGEPITNKIVWKNNLYRNNQQFWGLAISMGHLQYKSTWETITTKISLNLYGDNYQNNLMIVYSDKNYISETPATEGL